MALDPTSLLLATVVILVFYLWYRRHDPRLPPTPATPWPILGNLVHLESHCPRQQFLRWRKQFGDIFSVYMGPKLVIVLNGYESIKEALIKNSSSCLHRPFFYYAAVSGHPDKGIEFSNGPLWKEQRDVTHDIFRSLGVGKNKMADKILDIANNFVKALADLKGEPTDIDMLISMSVSNVIWSFTIGQTFEYDDKSFQKAIRYLRDNAAEGGGQSLANYFHFLQYIPGDIFNARSIATRARYIVENFVEKYVREIEQNEGDQHSDSVDNYITAYLSEKRRRLKAAIPTTMDDINLKRNIYDIYGAGTEPASATLYWCVLYLLHHPDMQEKLYQEVEREVGTQRLPNMQDRTKLTYLNAYISEIQRLASIVPFSVLLGTTEEVTLGGYLIPKGAYLLTNLDSVLWDEETWGSDAMSFRPERFIDDDGNLKKYEELIPFSIGKRMCIGEALARMEHYLFFAALIQRFKFVPEDPQALPPLKETSTPGFTTPPIHYKVRALDRRALP